MTPTPPQDAPGRKAPATKSLSVTEADVKRLFEIGAALCATVPDPEFPSRMNKMYRHRIAAENERADEQCKKFAIELGEIAKRIGLRLRASQSSASLAQDNGEAVDRLVDDLLIAATFHELEQPQRNADGSTMKRAAMMLQRLASRSSIDEGWMPVRDRQQDNWTYPYAFLEAVEKAMPVDDFAPGLEGIELALLGYERVMGRGVPLPPPPAAMTRDV